MITPNRWFWSRVKSEWRFQWNVFRLAVDWIVALYIVIPAAAFAVYQYLSWWRSAPVWLENVPLSAVTGLMYVLGTIGTLRFFMEEADQLFVLQRPAWRAVQLRGGMIYSLLFHGIGSALITAAAAPFLYERFHFSVPELVMTAVLLFAVRICRFAGVQVLETIFSGPRLAFARITALSAGAAMWAAGIYLSRVGLLLSLIYLALLLLAMAALLWLRLRLRGSFHTDVEREQREKMKYAGFLLAGIVDKRPKRLRRRPVLFRSSERLFRGLTQENGLAEAAVKSLLRSDAKLKLYLQLTGVCAVGMLFTPLPAKPILWLGSALLLALISRQFWTDSNGHGFLALFRWRDGVRAGAMNKAMTVMMIPGQAVVSLVYGLSYGWTGILLSIPAAVAAALVASRLVAGLAGFRTNRLRS